MTLLYLKLIRSINSAVSTNSATTKTVPCTFNVCPGRSLFISDCATSGCNNGLNDQYIRLYDASNTQVAFNDDFCTLCSSITYTTVGSSCQTYTLMQGYPLNK